MRNRPHSREERRLGYFFGAAGGLLLIVASSIGCDLHQFDRIG